MFTPKSSATMNEDGTIEVNGIGLGFLKLSASCFRKLHDAAIPYTDGIRRPRPYLRQPSSTGFYYSEDFLLCRKWQKEHGGKVFLDTEITCTHVGRDGTYTGDVREAFA